MSDMCISNVALPSKIKNKKISPQSLCGSTISTSGEVARALNTLLEGDVPN